MIKIEKKIKTREKILTGIASIARVRGHHSIAQINEDLSGNEIVDVVILMIFGIFFEVKAFKIV